MVKIDPVTDKGEQTRNLIFRSALDLFRESSFDATTMQEIATRAGVAKGAAYYYFPGKEAIILAYYELLQTEQETVCADAFRESTNLKLRLNTVLQSKFDSVRNDRKLLGVVFRYAGEPEHPLSCLGPATAPMRHRSIQVFRDAIAEEKLPKDLQELLPIAFWALQMGLLILFLYDSSEDQQRTRRVADGALTLGLRLLRLAKSPVLKPARKRILGLLRDADLLPQGRQERS